LLFSGVAIVEICVVSYRANLAAACGGILYFLFYIPYTMVVAWGSQMTLSLKLVAVSENCQLPLEICCRCCACV